VRKTAQSTYIFFIFALAVVFIATYLFYRYTATEFLEKRIANNLTMITETVSETLSYKIDRDYHKLAKYMEEKEYADIDTEDLATMFTEEVTLGQLFTTGVFPSIPSFQI
jgi:hypothetical protein